MLFRRALRNPRVLIQIGLFALVLGNLSLRFLHATPNFSEADKDGLSGFFYGVAIATMLLGLSRRPSKPAGS